MSRNYNDQNHFLRAVNSSLTLTLTLMLTFGGDATDRWCVQRARGSGNPHYQLLRLCVVRCTLGVVRDDRNRWWRSPRCILAQFDRDPEAHMQPTPPPPHTHTLALKRVRIGPDASIFIYLRNFPIPPAPIMLI
jgi:hypothetical protein